jgi:hypothetical protein
MLNMSRQGATNIRDNLLEKGLILRRPASEAPDAERAQKRSGYHYTYNLVSPEKRSKIRKEADPDTRSSSEAQNTEAQNTEAQNTEAENTSAETNAEAETGGDGAPDPSESCSLRATNKELVKAEEETTSRGPTWNSGGTPTMTLRDHRASKEDIIRSIKEEAPASGPTPAERARAREKSSNDLSRGGSGAARGSEDGRNSPENSSDDLPF